MKKSITLLLAFICLNAFSQDAMLENRLKVLRAAYTTPELFLKAAIDTQDSSVFKIALDEAGADLKKMKYPSYPFANFTPLMSAAMVGNVKMVQALLDRKVDIDATCKAALYSGETDYIKSVTGGSGKGFTAIHFAAQKGHKDVVRLLIIAGADLMASVEIKGGYGKSGLNATPKQWAKLHSQTEVEAMIKAGKKAALKEMLANPTNKKVD